MKRALIFRTEGSTEYTYTLEQLYSLKKHVDFQEELNVALRFFFHDNKLEPDWLETLEHWLRIAEEMKKNPNWIEDFRERSNNCCIERIEIKE